MSRLIVKNLPNGVRRSFNTLWYFSRNQNVPKIKAENVKKTGNPVENKFKLFEKLKEERLRKLFGEQGEVTDCSLKYTRSGQFRNFAFIGYKNEKDAQTALDRLNQTYIDTKKIQIEVARDFGDANKPRAWSKYSKESSANQRLAQESAANQNKAEESSANQKKAKKSSAYQRTAEENQIDNNEEDSNKQPSKKKKKKKRKENEVLNELKDDAGFQEFLEVHQNVSAKPVWTNDGGKAKKSEKEESEMAADSDDNDDGEDDDIVGHGDEEDVEDEGSGKEKDKHAAPTGLTDLQYLKSKVGNRAFLSDSSSSSADSSDDEGEADRKKKKKKKDRKKEKMKERKGDKEIGDQPEKEDSSTLHMVKMKGLPTSVSEKSIKEFFHPLNVVNIRIPRNAKKKPLGLAYVGFSSEKDLNQALGRNKNFIGGKRIYLKTADKVPIEAPVVEDKPRPWELKQADFQFQKEDDTETEGIAETGRLFVRNLAYSCTEEDLEEKFQKFGPLTEVNLPIDTFTKKIKGFAHITYMIPEHAVKAFTELDGKIFQGRMLHILPGKEKIEPVEASGGSSYKKQKNAKQKALAGSSHNWNALFLGANAVADVLAEKYEAEKSKILDTDMKGSLGVRLALGETQVVTETRKFLTDNGVSLDCFSQANATRSKTVMLVKNLPAGTTTEELQEMFSKYGTLGRVLLPPSGITAIVEYQTPQEARAGYIKLAYTKFKNLPLYLEWAPMEVFKETPVVEVATEEKTEQMDPAATEDQSSDVTETKVKQESEENKQAEEENKEEEKDTSAPGSTLFVKNLNFDTTDDALREAFTKCSKVKAATIARKKDIKNPGNMLSMGYGFVEFVSPEGAMKALKKLQHTMLDGHQLELKISNRTTAQPKTVGRKKQKEVEQKTTKLLVRNIPFEANRHEVEELFKVFGELKSVRLPKKMSGTGSHRGFGFVDFLTKQDAKKAFEALCHSTHLYGRRLVLEWAETADDIDEIRKRTAEHYHDDGKRKKLTKSGLKDHLEMMETD